MDLGISGKKAIICASTGNTSASASAYAAKFDLESYVSKNEGRFFRLGRRELIRLI